MPWKHEPVKFSDLKLLESFRQEFEGTVQIKWDKDQLEPARSVHRLTFVPDAEPEPEAPKCPRCGRMLSVWSEGEVWKASCCCEPDFRRPNADHPTHTEAIAAQAQRVAEPEPANPELLPCPFCPAGKPRLENGKYQNTWVMQCDNCAAIGPEDQTPERAIAAWNRRAPAAPDPAIMEWATCLRRYTNDAQRIAEALHKALKGESE